MRLTTLLTLALLAAAGCRQTEEEAQTADPAGDRPAARSSSIVAIEFDNPSSSSMVVTVGHPPTARAVGYKELLSTLTDAVAAARNEKVWVTLKADPMMECQHVTPALQACLEAGIDRITLNGRVASLCQDDNPLTSPCFYIVLEQQEFGPGLRISLNNDDTFAGGSPEENLRSMRTAFNRMRRPDIPDSTPVLLYPFPACEYRWMLGAYDVAEQAHFTNIQVRVPTLPPPPMQPPPKLKVGRNKVKPGPASPLLKEFPAELFPEMPDTIQVLPTPVRPPEWQAADRAFFRLDADEAAKAGKIVYLVDRSGSMTDSIEIVKSELKRAIGDLADDKQFHVIFYSSGPPVENEPKQLVAATGPNKAQAYKFIDNVVAQGETDPSVAIRRAFECKPDLIFLLTDGEFDRSIITLCKDLNKDRKIPIHTVGFVYQSGEPVLKEIAADSGGRYKFVTDVDLVSP
jgi:hypothetical protein